MNMCIFNFDFDDRVEVGHTHTNRRLYLPPTATPSICQVYHRCDSLAYPVFTHLPFYNAVFFPIYKTKLSSHSLQNSPNTHTHSLFLSEFPFSYRKQVRSLSL